MNTVFERTILVSDMDGTLLDSQGSISRKNIKALQHFVNLGGHFTLATGRSEATIARFMDELPVNLPVILYNGAVLYDFSQQRVLWTQCLPTGLGGYLDQLANDFPGIGMEIFRDGQVFCIHENSFTRDHACKELFSPQWGTVDSIQEPWFKVLCAWEHSRLVDVKTYVDTHFPGVRCTFSEPEFLEILHAGASKFHALEVLMDKVGLQGSRTVALGDSMNDMEMVSQATVGIAVENAAPALKAVARYHGAHHDAHALAQAISWLEEGMA